LNKTIEFNKVSGNSVIPSEAGGPLSGAFKQSSKQVKNSRLKMLKNKILLPAVNF